MSFTDDDLRRFKKYARKAVIAPYERNPSIQYALRALLFRLLARLEAAEAYLVALEFCLKHECIPWPCVAATDAKIAWRKAAGR